MWYWQREVRISIKQLKKHWKKDERMYWIKERIREWKGEQWSNGMRLDGIRMINVTVLVVGVTGWSRVKEAMKMEGKCQKFLQ